MTTVEDLHSLEGEYLVVSDKGYVDLWSIAPERLTLTAYAIVRRGYARWRLYGPDGRMRRVDSVAPQRRRGLLQQVLAYTMHNPRVDAAVTYAPAEAFVLDDLKEALTRAIEADDDVLSQFVEPAELLRQVRSAGSYGEILTVVRGAFSPPTGSP
jgi:hypothetical protein